jgi:hypothetical protein
MNSYVSEIKELSKKFIEKSGKSNENNEVNNILSRGLVCSELQTSKANQKSLDILFLGLNPSYISKDIKTFDSYNPVDKNTYPKYFKAFHTLVETIGEEVNWTQMDILNIRETKSNEVQKLIKNKIGLEAISENLKRTFKQIEMLRPSLVVVCNSKAAKFTGVEAFPENDPKEDIWMGYEFEFDQKLGVHRVIGLHPQSIAQMRNDQNNINTKLKGTPFLFTSTLSYMSKYVKESLAWQIRRVLDHQSNE